MSPAVITIEFVLDFICPWSYIYKRRLKRALRVCQNLHPEVKFNIEWRPYTLIPTPSSRAKRVDTRQRFINQLGPVKAHKMTEDLLRAADKCEEFIDATFETFFVKNKDIDDFLIMTKVIESMNVNKEDIKDSVFDKGRKCQVTALLKQNEEIGVTGCPFLIFNHTFGLAGAHSVDKLMFILEQLVEQAKNSPDS
ncbi:hypothetical protein IWQ62_003325 [Dispira parvispora]|uniref:DSBA-like thioredoxin domain-containing protein n=1 Tax=Dispira parvispora TaxID=1520584 RepID=A0A9W8E6M9_9FUNG|nr:hypothetical protein IWQ62_003325 [Dispira parvispora]